MKILLAAKHAPHGKRPIGGVQSWCRTVAQELLMRGHAVKTWGPEQPIPLGGFDLGIIANAFDTPRAFDWCRKTINVCHGIIPAEKPGTGDLVAFTSEEIRDHWGGGGPIVRQPIDLDFWSPPKVDQTPAFLTRFSYRSGLPFVPTLAKVLELNYAHIRTMSNAAARLTIHKSACVLATGRAALEAMACGASVVICDHRSAYQGPLMDLDTQGAMARNYSGRGGITPTMENVMQAIDSAMSADPLRHHVLDHHNVKNIVDQLLELS
jgi:hypothetical protein